MASKRKRGEIWEFTVKRAGVLPKPIYLTFESEAQGDAYCRNLEALLDKGIIPSEHQVVSKVRTIADLFGLYGRDAHPSSKDLGAFGALLKRRGDVALQSINAAWVDAWVQEMKRVEVLAPASIRARIGALARCTDWGVRKGYLTLPDNPLRTLPDGYAQYTKADASETGGGRVDVERDRRLEAGEWERILAVIDGGVLPRKQRPLKIDHPAAWILLVTVAVETGMRLREIYTLTVDQVNLPKRTVFLDKTKNGDKRQVPLSSVALSALKIHLPGAGKMVFPWWDGSERSLAEVSDHLSRMFAGIADAAGCDGLRFHDLRHEAVSRLFERTTLSEVAIMKISGHKSHKMLMRYSNLRGSDLSAALW
jgi:integrase